MDNIKDVLQAILDGQDSIRSDIKRVEKKVEENGERVDKLGLQLAYLEDDAPTRDEFDELQSVVKKIERKVGVV